MFIEFVYNIRTIYNLQRNIHFIICKLMVNKYGQLIFYIRMRFLYFYQIIIIYYLIIDIIVILKFYLIFLLNIWGYPRTGYPYSVPMSEY